MLRISPASRGDPRRSASYLLGHPKGIEGSRQGPERPYDRFDQRSSHSKGKGVQHKQRRRQPEVVAATAQGLASVVLRHIVGGPLLRSAPANLLRARNLREADDRGD